MVKILCEYLLSVGKMYNPHSFINWLLKFIVKISNKILFFFIRHFLRLNFFQTENTININKYHLSKISEHLVAILALKE